jgi:glutamate carboxypeptidase
MPYNELNRSTFDRIQKLATSRGITLTAGGTGGASDANFVAPLGIPVLDGLGPAGGDYHSEREYIFTNSLVERLALLSVILSGWGNDE